MSAKNKSSKSFLWIIAILALIAVGYFTYPQWESWFKQKILKKPGISNDTTELIINQLTCNDWVNETNGAMLSLKPQGNFSIDIPSVEHRKRIYGHFKIEKKHIIFLNHPSSNVCAGIEGIYKYKIKNNKVTFNVVIDRCASRRKYMDDEWFSFDSK